MPTLTPARIMRRTLATGIIAGATLLATSGIAQAYVPNIVAQASLATYATPPAGGVSASAISPDGRYAYYSLDSGDLSTRGASVQKFDLATMTPISTLNLASNVNGGFGFVISPDGTTGYGTYGLGKVVKFDLTTDPVSVVSTITVGSSTGSLETAAISPDGAYLYTGNQGDNKLYKVRLSDFSQVGSGVAVPDVTFGITSVAISPDGATVWVAGRAFSGGFRTKVVAFDTAAMTAGTPLTLAPIGAVRSGVTSPDGAYGYYATDNRGGGDYSPAIITKVNLATMTEVDSVTLPTITNGQLAGALAISADGTELYASTADYPAEFDVIQTSDMTLTQPTGLQMTTNTDDAAYGLLVSPSGAFVYLATYGTSPYQVVKIQVANLEPLAVTKDGAGTGTVTSSPRLIDCGATCTADFRQGLNVTLTAAPAAGSAFKGWSGACSGTSTTCTVSMSQAQSAMATFDIAETPPAPTPPGPTPPTPAPTPTPSPAPTPAPTRYSVIGITGTGAGATQTARMRVPGAGSIALSGTRTQGGRTVGACTKVTRTVSRAGVFRLTCTVNAATQAARRAGPVVLRLTSTYTPVSGTRQTVVRVVRLSAIGRPVPVTG